ncbi:MAG: hypothetical protein ACXQTS_04630 [Candidatus Methanospirareceae archaeon]
MPDEGLHLAITLFIIASCLREEERKVAVALAPFGLLCDLDVLFVHRATLHNVFVVFFPIVIMAIRRKKSKYLSLATLLLASHIFMDAFHNGVFLFYPLSLESYSLKFWFGLKGKGLSALFTWAVPGRVGEVEYVVKPCPSVPEIGIIGDGTELIILIFAILCFFFRFFRNRNYSQSISFSLSSLLFRSKKL